jgi:hypothetical protein
MSYGTSLPRAGFIVTRTSSDAGARPVADIVRHCWLGGILARRARPSDRAMTRNSLD